MRGRGGAAPAGPWRRGAAAEQRPWRWDDTAARDPASSARWPWRGAAASSGCGTGLQRVEAALGYGVPLCFHFFFFNDSGIEIEIM